MPPNQYSPVDRQWYTLQAHTYHEPMPPNQYSSAGRQGYILPAPGYPDAMPPNQYSSSAPQHHKPSPFPKLYKPDPIREPVTASARQSSNSRAPANHGSVMSSSHGNQRLTASNKQPETMPHKHQRKLVKTVSSRQEHPKSALHALKMSLYQGPAAKKARVIANSPDEEDDSDDATEDTLRVLSPRPGSDCTTQKHVAVTDKDVINEYIRQYRLDLPAVSSLWYQL
ncbi:hypothetical protein KCV07_g1397, partial [Aureobasidium melanogenum]